MRKSAATYLGMLRRIVYSGVTPGARPALNRCIALTNILTLMFVATISFFAVCFHLLGLNAVAWYCVFVGLLLTPWIYINARGWHMLARIGLIIVANIGGLILCLLIGAQSNVHVGFICLVGLSILLFEPAPTVSRFVTLGFPALSAVCFFLVEAGAFHGPLAVALSLRAIERIRLIVLPSYGLIVFFELFYFQFVNARVDADRERTRAALMTSAKLAILGEMAGGVAHEINNPLTIIRLTAHQVRKLVEVEPIDRPLVRKFTCDLEGTVERISSIIKGLRTFSRDGDQDPFSRLALEPVVVEAVSICREPLKQRGVDFQLKLFNASATVLGRATEISQVLVNLISNASDAIEDEPDQWIRVEMCARGDFYEIAVVDSGSGIPDSLRDKIFAPFFTTKSVGKGTGLGLSISRRLIEAHGGTLDLDSSASNTRFVITLPQAQDV